MDNLLSAVSHVGQLALVLSLAALILPLAGVVAKWMAIHRATTKITLKMGDRELTISKKGTLSPEQIQELLKLFEAKTEVKPGNNGNGPK